jgi:hypothetical protein
MFILCEEILFSMNLLQAPQISLNVPKLEICLIKHKYAQLVYQVKNLN